MLNTLNVKVATWIIECLSGGGAEGRALKAVRLYRKKPNQETESVALAALALLSKAKKIEVKQAARI